MMTHCALCSLTAVPAYTPRVRFVRVQFTSVWGTVYYTDLNTKNGSRLNGCVRRAHDKALLLRVPGLLLSKLLCHTRVRALAQRANTVAASALNATHPWQSRVATRCRWVTRDCAWSSFPQPLPKRMRWRRPCWQPPARQHPTQHQRHLQRRLQQQPARRLVAQRGAPQQLPPPLWRVREHDKCVHSVAHSRLCRAPVRLIV